MKNFVNILDYTTDELSMVLEESIALKKRMRQGIQDRHLLGKVLAMYFEKPSLRTRVSQESAMVSLGGAAILMDSGGQPLDARESLKDQAQVMSRYVDILSMRTFSHEAIEVFSQYATVPVVNTLSDASHPTQAMADVMTLIEHFGEIKGRTLTFVGDGNNVARSLCALCGKMGVRFVLACPQGYAFEPAFLEKMKQVCPDAEVVVMHDPAEAVRDACCVYTDVWASMGQEEEAAARRKAFMPFQLNAALMQNAPKDVIVQHCLPAHRGEEITDDVIDAPYSKVLDEAENRMHIYRGLFTLLLTEAC